MSRKEKKMKKKVIFISSGAVLASAVIALSCAFFVKGPFLKPVKGTETEYTITLEAGDVTSSESFESKDFKAYTDQLHNEVFFTVANVKRNGDYLEFKGESDGYIGNKTTNAIFAMKSVTIFFKEYVAEYAYTTNIKWGWENTGSVSYPYDSNIYTSRYDDGTKVRFDDDQPDFFKIINDDGDDKPLFIEKLIITYGNDCETQTSHGDPYRNINKLRYKRFGNHWAVMGYANYSDRPGDLVFESEIEGLPVTEISDYAFYYNGAVESVDFGESNITRVGEYSFMSCSMLETVDFRDSNVTTIGLNAFNSCSSLVNAYGLDVVEVFEDDCFAGVGITSVTFGDNLLQLNGSPFYGANSITSVTFSDVCEPTYISSGAFNWCQGIQYVHIGSLMTSIPEFYMSPIKAYTIGADPVEFKVDANGVLYSKHTASTYYLQRIPMGTELTSYTMPDYVDAMLMGCAQNCVSLQSVTLNSNIYSIASQSFDGCTNLQTVNFGSGSTVAILYSSAFKNCSSLTSITLPNTVTDIGADVFKNCTGLTSFTIPHEITEIGNAFEGCSNIATIYYDGTVEEWETRSIYKYSEWYEGISATVLTCTDGTIAIEDAD